MYQTPQGLRQDVALCNCRGFSRHESPLFTMCTPLCPREFGDFSVLADLDHPMTGFERGLYARPKPLELREQIRRPAIS
jgi:hypothetical protein